MWRLGAELFGSTPQMSSENSDTELTHVDQNSDQMGEDPEACCSTQLDDNEPGDQQAVSRLTAGKGKRKVSSSKQRASKRSTGRAKSKKGRQTIKKKTDRTKKGRKSEKPKKGQKNSKGKKIVKKSKANPKKIVKRLKANPKTVSRRRRVNIADVSQVFAVDLIQNPYHDVKFNSYLKQILRSQQPALAMGGATCTMLDNMIKNIASNVASEASDMMGRRKTLSEKQIQRAVKKCLPKNIREEVHEYASNAVQRYKDEKTKAKAKAAKNRKKRV